MRNGVETAWVRSLVGERCRDDSALAGDIVSTLHTSIRHALSSDLFALLTRWQGRTLSTPSMQQTCGAGDQLAIPRSWLVEPSLSLLEGFSGR
jgi:hypothetical protein